MRRTIIVCGAGAGVRRIRRSTAPASCTALSTSFLSTWSSSVTFGGRLELWPSQAPPRRRLARDHQRGFAGVDRLTELLHVRAVDMPFQRWPGTLPNGGADQRRPDDRRREIGSQRARLGRGATPLHRALVVGPLVLVDVELPCCRFL